MVEALHFLAIADQDLSAFLWVFREIPTSLGNRCSSSLSLPPLPQISAMAGGVMISVGTCLAYAIQNWRPVGSKVVYLAQSCVCIHRIIHSRERNHGFSKNLIARFKRNIYVSDTDWSGIFTPNNSMVVMSFSHSFVRCIGSMMATLRLGKSQIASASGVN